MANRLSLRGFLRRRLKPSVAGLMISVLFVGTGFGLFVRSARIQRDAVKAITNAVGEGSEIDRPAPGEVRYDWEVRGGVLPNYNAVRPLHPWVPRRLVDLLGMDYFGSVVYVRLPAGLTRLAS